MKKILLLYAHPAHHKSKVNLHLIHEISDLEGITFHPLYQKYPDFHIDIKKEQDLLLAHDIFIWHHPFYWYSSPALIKEWIDLVLQHNFAYGKMGRALEGKIAFNAITTGGSYEAYQQKGYNHYSIVEFLAPFRQTANLCRVTYYPPFVVHGTHLLKSDEIQVYASQYKEILISLRDELFDESEILSKNYINQLIHDDVSPKEDRH